MYFHVFFDKLSNKLLLLFCLFFFFFFRWNCMHFKYSKKWIKTICFGCRSILREKKSQLASKYIDHIWRAWYNGSYTIAAEPIKMLELHYPMIQFLIIKFIQWFESYARCDWSLPVIYQIQIHGRRHEKLVFFVLFNMARGFENVCEIISD